MKLQETALTHPSCTYGVQISGQLNQNYSSQIHNFKSSISNFISGAINLLMDRIKIGDILEFDSQLGTVTNVTLYNITLEISRLRTINIPNARIGESKTIRYKGKGRHKPDLSFILKDESFVNKAKDIVIEIMKSSNTIENDQHVTHTVYINQDKNGRTILTPFSYSKNNDTWATLWSLKNEMSAMLKKAGCIH